MAEVTGPGSNLRWRPEARHAPTFNTDQSDRATEQECHLIGSVRLEAMITIAR